MHRALILALIATSALAAPPSTCGQGDEYGRALCAYQRRNFTEAEAEFRAIADRNDPDPQTIRATYSLARTEIKLGRDEEAGTNFIRLYEMSKAYYEDWN